MQNKLQGVKLLESQWTYLLFHTTLNASKMVIKHSPSATPHAARLESLSRSQRDEHQRHRDRPYTESATRDEHLAVSAGVMMVPTSTYAL